MWNSWCLIHGVWTPSSPHRLRPQPSEGLPGLSTQPVSFLGGSDNCVGSLPLHKVLDRTPHQRRKGLFWLSVRSCIPSQLAHYSGGHSDIAYHGREDVAEPTSPLGVARKQWRTKKGPGCHYSLPGHTSHQQLPSSHQALPLQVPNKCYRLRTRSSAQGPLKIQTTTAPQQAGGFSSSLCRLPARLLECPHSKATGFPRVSLSRD